MKLDEYNMLLDLPQEISPKRVNYILEKWKNKGWYGNELSRIKDLAINKNKYIPKMDGMVVIVDFIRWNIGRTHGILVDCGDNGWHLYTPKTCKNGISSYFVGYDFKEVAYVELHPSPRKIWTKLNFLYWKHDQIEDGFHQKIHTMSPGTICDYSRASEGIFTHTNPAGKIGDCFPCCQCKFLGNE